METGMNPVAGKFCVFVQFHCILYPPSSERNDVAEVRLETFSRQRHQLGCRFSKNADIPSPHSSSTALAHMISPATS